MLSALAVAAVVQATAPGAVPRFPARAEMVKVTVVVTDAAGHPVTGLRREDFEVWSGGHRQDIAFFAAPGENTSTDVALAIDTSGSMARWQEALSSAAIVFLEEVPRARLRLLVSFDADVRFWNRDARAVDLLAQMAAAARVGGPTALYSAIAAIVERFEGPDRAALVLLTDGEDHGSRVSMQQALRVTQDANVTVYSVRFPSSVADDQGWAFLNRLAKDSGGRVFDGPGREPASVFKAITDDLASQYVLGFVPTDVRPGFHAVAVKVATTGVGVRHRAGYRRGSGRTGVKRTLAEIARGAGGRVGVSAVLVETGERVELAGAEKFPMQSVFKLPVALRVLRLVDEGTLGLNQAIRLGPEDMRRGRSPVRERWPGGITLTLDDLLRWMLTEGDNSAADALLRLAGGPGAVTASLRELGVHGVRVDRGEDQLARDLLDGGSGAMSRYLRDPRDTATPHAMADLLVAIAQGKDRLGGDSHDRLIGWMTETAPGAQRIKGLLPAGTGVAHRTGGGPDIGGVNACTNDVGIVTLPDGRHLAIAVFLKGSRLPSDARERVIARMARAVYDHMSARP